MTFVKVWLGIISVLATGGVGGALRDEYRPPTDATKIATFVLTLLVAIGDVWAFLIVFGADR